MRLLPLLGCVALLSCGPAGTVAPGDVKPADLEGWWLSVEAEAARVFGFVAPPDGPFSVPVAFEHRDAYLSANYSGPPSLASMSPKAWSTYDVKEGKLVETVIDSVDFDPGTTFTTTIAGLIKRDTLTVEASSGRRTYRWNEHCPVRGPSGWGGYQAMNFDSYFATAAALVFDSKGRLHSYAAMAGEQNGAVPARPTYGVLDKGCELIRFGSSNARASTMVVDERDVVHLVTLESAIYSEHPDSTLVHRSRPADGTTWTTEVLDATPSNRALELVTHGPRLVLVVGTTELRLYEQRDGAWQTRTVTVAGQPVQGALLGAAIDSANRLYVAGALGILRETNGADFEVLPYATGTNLRAASDFFIDADDRLHQRYTSPLGSQHGVFDGTSWQLTLLPEAEQLVASARAPWVFTAKTRHAFPYFVVGTQAEDGTVRYELSSGAPFNPAAHTTSPAAVSANGTLAVSPTGEHVHLKRPTAPAPQLAPVQLNLGGTGTGRVTSQDGVIDCAASCSLQLPVFSRYRLRVQPGPDSALAKQAGEPDAFPTEYTWLTVWPESSAEFNMFGGQNTLSFEFDRNVVREVVPLGAATNNPATPDLFDARQGSVAVAYSSSSGTVFFRDATYTAAGTGSGAVLLLEAAGAPLVTRLPAVPRALSVLEAGGAQGAFFATTATSFGGMTWGSSTAPAVVRLSWDLALTATAELVATFPAQTRFVAAKTHANGALAVLVQNPNGLPALGANVLTALAWRGASGQVRTTAFPAGVQLTTAALATNGAQLVVRSNDTLTFFDDGLLVQTRTAARARYDALAFTGSGLLATAVASGDGADFGGGPLSSSVNGEEYLARYGPTGAFVGAQALGLPTTTLAMNEQPRGVLRLLQTMGGPQLQFTPGLTAEWLTTPPNATRAMSAVNDGEVIWALVQQQLASVDYGVGAPVASSGRLVLVKLVMP